MHDAPLALSVKAKAAPVVARRPDRRRDRCDRWP